MKKFCSSCGTQLELSKRYCVECGDVNPYFVPAFLLLSDQSDALEKLRLEKEKIERELLEKQEKQAEFIRQELLRKELEQDDWKQKEALAKEVLLQEAAERERAENELKKEILQLKEEAELNKKETIGMLRVVRYELQQKIDTNNKQLKEEFELANKKNSQTAAPSALSSEGSSTGSNPAKDSGKRNTGLVAVIVFLLLLVASAYFYFGRRVSDNPKPEVSIVQPVEQSEATLLSGEDTVKSEVKPTISSLDSSAAPNSKPLAAEVVPEKKAESVSEPVAKLNSIPATNAVLRESSPVISETPIRLTESRIRTDIIGKKISGCGITINKRDEIEQLGSLVFIETLPSGSVKYKFSAKIVQGEDTYYATPYIYYTSKGGFIKIDGTNCE